MLMWLKRLFFGDDRLFLQGSHLARVIRDDRFHGVPDVGQIVDGPTQCQLVLNYERGGCRILQNIEVKSGDRSRGNHLVCDSGGSTFAS